MCAPNNKAPFAPAMHVDCAASFLVNVTGNNPEDYVTRDHADEAPEVNSRVLLSGLVEAITDAMHDAMEDDNHERYAEAANDRDDVIILFADVLRSDRYAASLWTALVCRGGDVVSA